VQVTYPETAVLSSVCTDSEKKMQESTWMEMSTKLINFEKEYVT